MSNNKKKTGLGTSAFFASPTGDGAQTATAEAAGNGTKQPEKPKKVRTTITLYPETLAAMELLKAEARKTGKKVTLSDVFADAVDALMAQRGLSLEQLR